MNQNPNIIDDEISERYKEHITVERLTRETKRLEKDIEHIKQSRLFKMSKVVRPFSYLKIFFLRLFRSGSILKENSQLAKELIKRDYIISKQTEQLDFIDKAIEGISQNDASLDQALIKLLNQEGLTLDFINELQKSDELKAEQIKRIVDQLSRSYRHLKDEAIEQKLYQQTALLYKKARFPEYLIRIAEERNISYSELDSFSDRLLTRFRMKQAGATLPEELLDDKWTAYEFVDQMKILRPRQSEDTYTINTIPKEEKIVIKPTASDGGRGVYLVESEQKIYDIKREKQLSSWDELTDSMQKDLNENLVIDDQWYTEQLLKLNDQEPARDLKFYCFYGVVALVLEVNRIPTTRYCWWDDKGQMTTAGKYDAELFDGLGVSEEEIERVRELSTEIPVPFMRIDFLRTESGLVFGEFTPKPGNFDQFNPQIDRWLGQLYIEAEVRLLNDLLNGKIFTHYKNILNSRSNE